MHSAHLYAQTYIERLPKIDAVLTKNLLLGQLSKGLSVSLETGSFTLLKSNDHIYCYIQTNRDYSQIWQFPYEGTIVDHPIRWF